MSLIHGKQLRDGSIQVVKLSTTGATDGYVATYDSANDGLLWQSLSTLGVSSVSGRTALDQTVTTGDVVLDVRTDNASIYVDGSNDITLGDPTNNNLISGGDYRFAGSLIVNGDFTVLGTATTINTQTLSVEDNLITLNSTFTAGTPTVNGGIEILRGSDTTVQFRWNETNDWWELSNPEGTGTTYSAVLTTGSIESTDTALVVTQGTGGNADKLFLSIDEASLTGIPNSGLTNSSITINAGTNMGGGGTVALGGSITLSADSVNETWAQVLSNGNTSGGSNATLTAGDVINSSSGSGELDLRNGGDSIVTLTNDAGGLTDSGVYFSPDYASLYSDGFTSVFEAQPNLISSYLNNIAVTLSNLTGTTIFSKPGISLGTTATGNLTSATIVGGDSGANTIGAFINSSGSMILNGASNTVVIGGAGLTGSSDNTVYVPTLNINSVVVDGSITDVLVLDTDGTVKQRTVASLSQDSFVTGGTASYPGPSNTGSLTLGRNNGLIDVVISNLEDTFVTGGTLSGSDVILGRNDGGSVTIDLSGLDINDTFSISGSVTTIPTDNSDSGVITIGGNAGFTPYTITGVDNTYTTGTTVDNGTGIITFYKNDGNTYNADLSGFDFNDTFVTGGTVSNGSLTLNRQDDTVNVTGVIVQSVSGTSPITASTTNGAVTVGIDYTSMLQTVPTTSDKGQTITGSTTSGNNSDTGILVTTTPANNGYVGTSINGLWYEVGDGVTSTDCYFSSDGTSGGVRAIADIVSGDKFVWNGIISGFELDSGDRVDFYYDVLQ